MRIQGDESFNPVDYCFEWTDPKPGDSFGWYTWDGKEASRQARKERDDRARELTREGKRVHKWASRGQLITRGGIGTTHPEISLVVTVYHVSRVVED